MRLINTKTLECHQFFDAYTPPYAILSHRWGENEMSFEDISSPDFDSNRDSASLLARIKYKRNPRFQKVIDFCELCQENKILWCWVDTCCIDKTSSAELSEAINSMYKWYSQAEICCVYLEDVSAHELEPSHSPMRDRIVSVLDWPESMKNRFRASRWFTRGWTLQELLAPGFVQFFSGTWRHIGTKYDLADLISETTDIRAIMLKSDRPIQALGVAERMSWASKRQTTRGEDLAYCLLGLFDVHMPLLYGEGAQNAFLRLQLEIMRNSDDESLFAWWRKPSRDKQAATGLLAALPIDFSSSGDIVPDESASKHRKPYVNTTKGIEFTVTESSVAYAGPQWMSPQRRLTLACIRRVLPSEDPSPYIPAVEITIEKTSSGQWVRSHEEIAGLDDYSTYELALHLRKMDCVQIYIASTHGIAPGPPRPTRATNFQLKEVPI